MSGEIKIISLKEFRDKGYLLEANRLFFHPLGLALAVSYGEGANAEEAEPTGLFVYDWRDDPEGGAFETFNESDLAKSQNVAREFEKRRPGREKRYGNLIQPAR